MLADTVYRAFNESVATKSDVAQLRQELKSSRKEFRAEFNLVNGRIDATSMETKSDMEQLRQEFKAEFNLVNGRIDAMSDRIDATNDRIDDLKAQMQVNHDSLKQELEDSNEKLGREIQLASKTLSANLFRFLWLQGAGIVAIMIGAIAFLGS